LPRHINHVLKIILELLYNSGTLGLLTVNGLIRGRAHQERREFRNKSVFLGVLGGYTARDSRIGSAFVGQPPSLRSASVAKLFKFSFLSAGYA
jgi:hypothetical protein